VARTSTILFDNDGVLVDTERVFFEANRRMLAGLGLELTETHFADYSLTRGVTPLEMAVERGVLLRGAFPALLRARDDQYETLLRENDSAIDGVVDVLASLDKAYRIGVVTSSKRRHFDVIHERSGLRRYFEFVLTREDYERSKPHPDPYLLALGRCQASPAECVAVEDSPRGVRAAVAAGLRCVAIPNPLSPGGDFSSAIARLGSIRELPDWLAAREVS
jgi:HAD superfamily hydrolase (TIGR01509 family)